MSTRVHAVHTFTVRELGVRNMRYSVVPFFFATLVLILFQA